MEWKKKDACKTVKECHLRNMGVASTDEINEWFLKSYHDQYRINGLDQLKAVLSTFKNKPIYICGDYDVDGVMAVTVMYMTLARYLKYPKVKYVIPERHTQGYGLNIQIVEKMVAESEPGCLITVDNGIAAIESIAYAKKMGWTVIVTDHHLQAKKDGKTVYPNADLIIDPQAIPNSSDFNGYCGAGLAYKVACELIGRKAARSMLPFAAIATIADLVELTQENYVIVRNGLDLISKGYITPGLKALKSMNQLDLVDDSDVGFKIAPQINAPGRLYKNGAMFSVGLMLSDSEKADDFAYKIKEINEVRKGLVREAVEKIEARFEQYQKTDPIIIEYLPNVNQGIIGIVAGNICEKYKRPVIILTEHAADHTVLTGSARSVHGFHIKNFLDKIQNYVLKYGGHEVAAGLSIKADEYDVFKNAALEEVKRIGYVPSEIQEMYYDLEINADKIHECFNETYRFAPFGNGNDALIFKINGFTLRYQYGDPLLDIGKSGIRLSGTYCNAISFDLRDRIREETSLDGIVLYGKITRNQYNGKVYPQVEILDYKV